MLGLVLVFSDIPKGLGTYSCGKKTALRPDGLGRWLEWRPKGAEGWGQRSLLGIGQSVYVCWANGLPLTSIASDSTMWERVSGGQRTTFKSPSSPSTLRQ